MNVKSDNRQSNVKVFANVTDEDSDRHTGLYDHIMLDKAHKLETFVNVINLSIW